MENAYKNENWRTLELAVNKCFPMTSLYNDPVSSVVHEGYFTILRRVIVFFHALHVTA